MNANGFLMLAGGLVVGVLVGRNLKRCAAPPASTATDGSDVLISLAGLGGKVFDGLFAKSNATAETPAQNKSRLGEILSWVQ